MTIALVDADIVAYRCAASAEKDSLEIALVRASRLLKDIVSTTNADETRLFLTGTRNFRKDIYTEYKANRIKMVRPQYLENVREYLVLEWGAKVQDGIEADDALGIEMGLGGDRVCCSIDKDLLQLPGLHYNFVSDSFREVDYIEGWRNFYKQLVLGDKGDNIPGFDGKMRLKFPKFLEATRVGIEQARSPHDMFSCVKGIYKGTEEELIRNGRLLYIWRKENDDWQPPTPAEDMSGEKRGAEARSESTVTTPEATIPYTEHGGMKRKSAGCPPRGLSKGSQRAKTPRAASILKSSPSNSRGRNGKKKGQKERAQR